jgi:hypothetical protein
LDFFSAQANAQGDFSLFFGSQIEKAIDPKFALEVAENGTFLRVDGRTVQRAMKACRMTLL